MLVAYVLSNLQIISLYKIDSHFRFFADIL